MSSSFSSSRIIYASHGDGMSAILAKLQRRRGSSVVLVANKCPALHNGQNLARLRREAADLALDLTLVCGDPAVRRSAGDLGIKAVNSLAAVHAAEHAEAGLDSADEFSAASTAEDSGSTGLASRRDSSAGQPRSSGGSGSSSSKENPVPLATLSTRDSKSTSGSSGGRGPRAVDRSFSTALAWATLIVVVLFLAWGAVYVALPSARVQLTPVQQRYSTELQLMADPDIRRIDAAAGKIPAELIVIEETDELTAPATGARDEPIGKAEGSVILRNQISQPVTVPRGTVLLTNDNRRYVTAAQVTVPLTSATSGDFGFQRVTVVAEELGPIGNAEPGAISHIEDLSLNQRLEVENDTPIQGGAMRAVTFVTEEDRLQLFEKLREELMHRVYDTLGSKTDSDHTLVPWDATNVIVELAEYNKEVGEEAESLTLRMKVKLRGTAFSRAYLSEVAPIIVGRIVENQLGTYELRENSLNLGPPGVVELSPEGVVLLTLEVQGDLVSAWDHGEIRRLLANATRQEAERHLSDLKGVGEFAFEIGPDWYDRMPRLWFRISIEVMDPIEMAA